ncbi:hypothetical protein JS578_08685 [Dysgonomonadaceae bacterium zrk40]|nr:hypothetical protein JS578_08685 [Dysgonomonadaceae bacterium zrk40]
MKEEFRVVSTRDLCVFMFYCIGLNFGVLCRLRYENIDVPYLIGVFGSRVMAYPKMNCTFSTYLFEPMFTQKKKHLPVDAVSA